MIAAFAYLTTHTIRNRVRSQLLRLKNPRYAIALALGLFYFYFVYFRPNGSLSNQSNPLASDVMGTIVPILVFAYIAYLWIVGSDRSALAFTQAEVSMLFTAPVSRRGLIIYKLVRSQAAVLVTSLVWYVIFRRPGAAGWERALGSWVFLSTMSLHRLGAALVNASSFQHGSRGLRKAWLPLAIFAVALAIVAKGMIDVHYEFSAARDAKEIFLAISDAFSSAPLSWVLFPFRASIAPLFAANATRWMAAMGPALLVLALHFVWVLRMDTAFEESAAEASAKLAHRLEAMRTRGVTATKLSTKSARRSIPLAPIGPPAVALLWKNVLWLLRTGQLRGLVLFPMIAGIAAVGFAGRSETAELLVMIMCGAVTLMTFVFGPMTMRNDLRGDLRRLPMIKTLPLPGREIILAEVASSSIPTAAMQFLLVAVGLFAMGFLPKDALPADVRLGALLGAPFLLIGLSIANFTIHNGFALLFPGWVRLGEAGAAGVEMMGQMMLVTIITFTLLALLLVIPALITAVTVVVLQWPTSIAVATAGVIGGATLAGESYLLMTFLGSSLDKLEPMHVG